MVPLTEEEMQREDALVCRRLLHCCKTPDALSLGAHHKTIPVITLLIGDWWRRLWVLKGAVMTGI